MSGLDTPAIGSMSDISILCFYVQGARSFGTYFFSAKCSSHISSAKSKIS